MSIHTATYNITKLVYIESHETAPDAIEREKQIKRWRREKKIALIDAANPEWLDLSSEVYPSSRPQPSVARRSGGTFSPRFAASR